MTLNVLVAEDDPEVAAVVAFGMRMTWPGCRVRVARTGEEAIRLFAAATADLVVLDVAMPPPDGFAVLRHIRASSQTPVLMLTVRGATHDKVRAFELGADDYLTKPFDHLELLARLRALLRRANGAAHAAARGFAGGDLAIDFATRAVRVAGQLVRLTSTEYRLLEVLARHAGCTVPHHVLIEQVWGSEWASHPDTIKVFVRRLRQKLGDPADHPRYILTEWGIGYRLATGLPASLPDEAAPLSLPPGS
jgi:DNA-binding response OmpR family regulator